MAARMTIIERYKIAQREIAKVDELLNGWKRLNEKEREELLFAIGHIVTPMFVDDGVFRYDA